MPLQHRFKGGVQFFVAQAALPFHLLTRKWVLAGKKTLADANDSRIAKNFGERCNLLIAVCGQKVVH